jgi:hypothetical protein
MATTESEGERRWIGKRRETRCESIGRNGRNEKGIGKSDILKHRRIRDKKFVLLDVVRFAGVIGRLHLTLT